MIRFVIKNKEVGMEEWLLDNLSPDLKLKNKLLFFIRASSGFLGMKI